MSCSLLFNLYLTIIVFNQYSFIVNAGNCFLRRTNDVCFDLSEKNVSEEECTGSYYSDESLEELDGSIYAEGCRDTHVPPKRCDVDCGLGQECQWIDGEEMCVCSEESCISSHTGSSNVVQHRVCASNNMTFSSECFMEAWKCLNHRSALYKKYDGECQKDCRNVKCPENNICVLVKNTGEPICYPKQHCKPELDSEPVCGTNGITYSNICALRLARDRRGRTVDLAHKGNCEEKCRPDLCETNQRCVYSKRSRPVCIRCQYPRGFFIDSGECSGDVSVCGENGQLYKNYCSLLRDQCEKSQYIKIIDYGSCPDRKSSDHIRSKLNYLNRINSLRLNRN